MHEDNPSGNPVDVLTAELRARGWGYGWWAKADENGVIWVADAHKGDQKCIAKAPKLETALTELLKLLQTEDEG